ncbi:MAG: hypothetical protein ACUZ8E_08780 [Candidatus Anammoxibacter sp.]
MGKEFLGLGDLSAYKKAFSLSNYALRMSFPHVFSGNPEVAVDSR